MTSKQAESASEIMARTRRHFKLDSLTRQDRRPVYVWPRNWAMLLMLGHGITPLDIARVVRRTRSAVYHAIKSSKDRLSTCAESREEFARLKELMKGLPILIALLLIGCASPRIPNFAQVEPGVYRGGQPNAAGWAYLKSIGVTHVVKLNTEAEGSDASAERQGMTIYRCPINLYQQLGLARMPKAELEDSGVYMTSNEDGAVFVHCQHGQDRTGLAIALYRVMHDGWSKDAAEKEMLSLGFHKELHGLWEMWKEFSYP